MELFLLNILQPLLVVTIFDFRFDQKLKDAVNLNTVGTHRVLQLAETMENLEVRVQY